MLGTIFGPSFAARFTLVSLLTVSYAGAVLINNNLLFSWTVDNVVYRHWIFVPAGLQLLYVMLFGWRGVLGIILGSAAVYLSYPLGLTLPNALFIASLDSLAVWASVEFYSMATGIRFPWTQLSWRSIPTLSFLSGGFSAVAVFVALLTAGIGAPKDALRDIALFSLGDFLGSWIFFAAVLLIRKQLKKARVSDDML